MLKHVHKTMTIIIYNREERWRQQSILYLVEYNRQVIPTRY